MEVEHSKEKLLECESPTEWGNKELLPPSLPQKKKKKKYKNYRRSWENISVLTLLLHFQAVLNVFIQTYKKHNHVHPCSFILETLFVEILPKIMGSVFRYTENPLLRIAS